MKKDFYIPLATPNPINQNHYEEIHSSCIPERLTHHGMSDRMLDWTPDGEALLYASSMESGKQRWPPISGLVSAILLTGLRIFNDAWRFDRDYFYDTDMQGVNWDAMRKQYGDLIKYAVSRSDVNFIIGELIGELNASHTYRGGGDWQMPKRKQVGYPGIDWEMENGYYKVKKIIRGAPWDNEVVSPLDAPGVDGQNELVR